MIERKGNCNDYSVFGSIQPHHKSQSLTYWYGLQLSKLKAGGRRAIWSSKVAILQSDVVVVIVTFFDLEALLNGFAWKLTSNYLGKDLGRRFLR